MKNHLSRIWTSGGSLLRRFRGDARGNVAVITGLVAIPLFASAGIAIDYARQQSVTAYMQAEADAAALAGAVGGPTAGDQVGVTAAKDHTKSRYGDSIENVSFQGTWLNATDFKVAATAKVPVTIMGAVPGIAKEMDVDIIAVARYSEPVLEYKPPVLTDLDPEAWDYNRIYVYCYDSAKKGNADKGRSQMTAVADNGGTKYTYTMPVCGPKETLSFRLYNVRNMRTTKSKWDKGSAERYNYYTDTVVNDDGSETYSLGYSLLETILCDTSNQCKPVNQGGIIQEGPNRTPKKATSTCSTGKFFYYGWEDRPPEKGGSDRDYNDIRIVLECPTVKASGQNSVRLIK
ncbi:TadE/TadG family type IV pilus assembly protein [Taklimakanibacter lacteus]|uniref:TadE/TadG family type IV pilus assembly protein n=1 Tax=Taklimakanibacter lacteus TaxID=2268456 RepID=UPI000E66FDE6